MKKKFIEEFNEHTNSKFSLEYKKCLYRGKSKFQKIEVFDTIGFGKTLLLDGCFMVTEKDHHLYHNKCKELIGLKKRKLNILIIGGGDGGTLREVLRHSEVERATLCEIDEGVVLASREFLPTVCESAFEDIRVNLHIGDGISYMREAAPESLDVIIVDSTDPVGPGEVLFGEEFYTCCRRALRPGGLIALQSESPWEDSALFSEIQKRVRNVFGETHPYLLSIPTYPSGTWSLTVASVDSPIPSLDVERAEFIARGCRYYTPEVHSSAFVLPAFVQRLLG